MKLKKIFSLQTNLFPLSYKNPKLTNFEELKNSEMIEILRKRRSIRGNGFLI